MRKIHIQSKGGETVKVIRYKFNGEYYTKAEMFAIIDLMLYRKVHKIGRFEKEKYAEAHRTLKNPVLIDEE